MLVYLSYESECFFNRDLVEFLEFDGEVSAVAIQSASGLKTIIKSTDMIKFDEAYVQVVFKREKPFMLLMEK